MLMFRYKKPQAVTARLLGFFAAIYGAALVWFFTELKKAQEQPDGLPGEEIAEYVFQKIVDGCAAVRDRIFPFSVLIFAAIILSGYFLFAGRLERRER
ncbi:MAG: hypothetical protein NC086_08055, partial [Alistipes sp.]|nr:hypothetical protein [Alistipes sp.]